jgi:hypothetical protein
MQAIPTMATSRGRAGSSAGTASAGGTVGDLGVEPGDSGDVVPQGRDLADHVHPVPLLVGLVDRGQAGPVPLEALGRDPQPAQVELLQLGPHVLLRRARSRQPPAGLVERLDVGRGGAAGGVAGRGLQQHRLPAVDRRPLEAGEDGARGHRLLGEQVRRPHEDADGGAGRRQGRGRGRDHGCRPLVADAAGEENVQVREGIGHGQEAIDLGVPQGEAGPGTDVAAALEALEHEPAGALPQEAVEEAGRGDVQVGGDAGGFEGCRLRGTAAGDEGVGGADLVHHRQLRLADLGRGEPEDPDAPWEVAQELGRLRQQAADLVARHQGQGQEGQPAALGHGQGEGGPVADPGHRSLDDLVPQAGPAGGGAGEVGPDRLGDGLNDAAGGDEAVGQGTGEGPVLAHRQQLGAQVWAEAEGHVGVACAGRFDRQVGPGEHPVAVDDDRLAPVHGRDGGRRLPGQPRLPHQ